jgi:hypothetical protein
MPEGMSTPRFCKYLCNDCILIFGPQMNAWMPAPKGPPLHPTGHTRVPLLNFLLPNGPDVCCWED